MLKSACEIKVLLERDYSKTHVELMLLILSVHDYAQGNDAVFGRNKRRFHKFHLFYPESNLDPLNLA